MVDIWVKEQEHRIQSAENLQNSLEKKRNFYAKEKSVKVEEKKEKEEKRNFFRILSSENVVVIVYMNIALWLTPMYCMLLY